MLTPPPHRSWHSCILLHGSMVLFHREDKATLQAAWGKAIIDTCCFTESSHVRITSFCRTAARHISAEATRQRCRECIKVFMKPSLMFLYSQILTFLLILYLLPHTGSTQHFFRRTWFSRCGCSSVGLGRQVFILKHLFHSGIMNHLWSGQFAQKYARSSWTTFLWSIIPVFSGLGQPTVL